jgi:zinc finger HIT domain-containing protein 1
MDNFGVIELASTKTTSAPGWAYVPDRAQKAAAAAAAEHPPNRKRATRTQGKGLSASDQSARVEARVRKELGELEREGGRDIPIPARKGGEFFFVLPSRGCSS